MNVAESTTQARVSSDMNAGPLREKCVAMTAVSAEVEGRSAGRGDGRWPERQGRLETTWRSP